MADTHSLTVAELIVHLQAHAKDKPVVFGCPELEFNRVKDRGSVVQIEFNQNVYQDSTGTIVVESFR